MTTTSITSAQFGRISFPINWNLDPDKFDYNHAEEYYHTKIQEHFDEMCQKLGSSGSLYLWTSEVLVEIDDEEPDVDFFEILGEAARKAYDDLCEATEEGLFDLKGGQK